VTRLELQRQFIALRQELGKTAIFVTHDVREALFLGTQIALLVDGAIQFVGTRQAFMRTPTAEARAFLECLQPVEV